MHAQVAELRPNLPCIWDHGVANILQDLRRREHNVESAGTSLFEGQSRAPEGLNSRGHIKQPRQVSLASAVQTAKGEMQEASLYGYTLC